MYYPYMNDGVTMCQAVDYGFANVTRMEALMSVAEDQLPDVVCVTTPSEPTTYYIILVMGACFGCLYSLVALSSDRLGMIGWWF